MKRPGFMFIELMIVLSIISIIASIAIPNLVRSKMSANEASAIGSLRTLSTAQIQFKSAGVKITSGAAQYGNLNLLFTAIPPFLGQVLGGSNSPVKSGYQFTFVLGSIAAAPSFEINANVVNEKQGSRNFFMDNFGYVTWLPQSAGNADSTSPVLE